MAKKANVNPATESKRGLVTWNPKGGYNAVVQTMAADGEDWKELCKVGDHALIDRQRAIDYCLERGVMTAWVEVTDPPGKEVGGYVISLKFNNGTDEQEREISARTANEAKRKGTLIPNVSKITVLMPILKEAWVRSHGQKRQSKY